MAVTIVRSLGPYLYRGIHKAEVGINVKRFQCRYFPEQDIRHPNAAGETFIRSMSAYLSREVQCEGEITAYDVGVMAFGIGVSCTFANNTEWFPPALGTFLFEEAVVTEDRAGWVTVSIKCSSNPFL